MVDQGTSRTATGRIDCQYQSPDGKTQRWSLVQFDDLKTEHDARKRFWRSKGTAVSNSRPPRGYELELGYDESRRILSININGYLFAPDQLQAMASNYGRTTLNIKFLRDTEGANVDGDHFTIKGNSRLDIPV